MSFDHREYIRDELAAEHKAASQEAARRRAMQRAAPRTSFRAAPAEPGPAERKARSRALRSEPDTHELLKREMFTSPSAACDDHFSKNLPCPSAPMGVSDQHVVLDSFRKSPASRLDQGQLSFNLMIQGVTGRQVIGVKDRLSSVIEIQIGAFDFPNLPEVPYTLQAAPGAPPTGRNQLTLIQNNNSAGGVPPLLVPLSGVYGQYPPAMLPTGATYLVPFYNNPYTQTPFGGRLTVYVQEAGLQSISDADGARHHFELTLTQLGVVGYNPGMLCAVPSKGTRSDTYSFTDPLQDLPSLTLVFRGPDLPLRFQPDVYAGVQVVSDGAAAPGPYLRFNVAGHGLLMGDRFFVTDFASGIPALDAFVNRAEGLVASGDPAALKLAPGTPLPTADFFWSDPAVSIIDFSPAPVLPQTVTVYIAKRRLRIPLRIRSVVPRLTNYVTPV
jgi:hypothetical protein